MNRKYQKLRETAGLSRMAASQAMDGISQDRLYRIENGVQPDPYDIVQMAKTYDTPLLTLDHCASHCAIGVRRYRPIPPWNLELAVLHLLDHLETVDQLKKGLLHLQLSASYLQDWILCLEMVRILLAQSARQEPKLRTDREDRPAGLWEAEPMNENTYLSLREKAGLSRMAASTQMKGISQDRLYRIENGMRPEPWDIVQMAQVYHSPLLPLHHCQTCCAIGKCRYPTVPSWNREEAVLHLLDTLEQVPAFRKSLLTAILDPSSRTQPLLQQISRLELCLEMVRSHFAQDAETEGVFRAPRQDRTDAD